MRPKSSEKHQGPIKTVVDNRIILSKGVPTEQESKKKSTDVNSSDESKIITFSREQNAKNVLKKTMSDEFDRDTSNDSLTVVNTLVQKKINCRLCDKDITGKECQLLYDQEENVETRLGRKINIIINSTETQFNLSQYCCSACTSKIEICFSLLVEIQASDEVIKQTYGNLTNGVQVDTSTQLFICGECKSTITGIKSFIRHYENHILKKTVINSRRDVKVSQLMPEKIEDCDEVNDVEGIRQALRLNGRETEDEKLVDDPFVDDQTQNTRRSDSKVSSVRKQLSKSLPDPDISLSGDELYTKSIDADDGDRDLDGLSDVALSEENGEYDVGSLDKNAEGVGLSDSEASGASDTSYQKLVSIVKRELEKSDSDEDPNMEIAVDYDGKYCCSSCGQSFDYKFLLIHHLANDHKWNGLADESGSEVIRMDIDEDGYVSCPQCQELFLPNEIEKHLESCAAEFRPTADILCHACGKLCPFKQWPSHKKKHMSHAGLWACELCGKRFKAKRILRSHLGEHDESKKKVCEICGKKLLPLSFFSHMMKHKEKRHVCQFCGKGFTYNYGLRMHLRVHDGSERLEMKTGKKRDRVFCWMCKKDFDSSAALHKHLKNQHNVEGMEQDSRFACSECDKKFADMFGLKAHLKLIHEMKDEEISRFKSLPVYRYIECNVCNQVFNSENKVRIHMKQDHGLKPFEMEILKKECEKCGKRFASKQNLIHHINGAHLNIKPMQCDICNERFAKHSSLIYHKLRHSGEKPFECEFCHKTYRQRNDVIRHLARHVRDEELTLEEASAINNSPSPLVLKRRIFLKDSSISYQALVSRQRRQKTEVVGVYPEPIENKVEYDEGSLIYVEEVMADEIQQPESPVEVKYMTVKPVYNEERNTIILSSPELFKNAVENVSYRYVNPHGKDVPAVIVKKEAEM